MHSLEQVDQLLRRPELQKWDPDTVACATMILRSMRGLDFCTGGSLTIGAHAIARGWAGHVRCSGGKLRCSPTLAGAAFAKATMLAVMGEMALSLADAPNCPAANYALQAGLRAHNYVRAMQRAIEGSART